MVLGRNFEDGGKRSSKRIDAMSNAFGDLISIVLDIRI